MMPSAFKPGTLIAAVAGLGAVLAVSLPPKDPREACLRESLQDVAASRWVEPRLSGGFQWQRCSQVRSGERVLAEIRCPPGHPQPPAVSMVSESCDGAGRRHVKALRALLHSEESEKAVEILESLSRETPTDPRRLSDLAAAYLVRARRTDRPADLLRALEAARRAVAQDPDLPEACFNLALAQEALQLPAVWDQARLCDLSSPWAREALERKRRLESESARAAATVWPLNRQRLAAVVRAGGRQALAELIQPFPAATHRYLVEEVLVGWAHAGSQGRQEEAKRHLALAQAVAEELSELTGDRYLAASVGAIAEASGSPRDAAKLPALVAGHLALGEARLAQQAQTWRRAGDLYRQAGRAFTLAGSPLRAEAELGLAVVLYQEPGGASQVLARLEPIEKEARRRGYRYLLGRVLWFRAVCLALQGHFLEALPPFDEAIRSFQRIGDLEDAANVRVRRAGLFRILGEGELAWQEAFQALPDLPRMVGIQAQHYALGETAAAVLALGYPRIALLYQAEAVERIEGALRTSSLERREEEVQDLHLHLAVALRARAAIRTLAGRHDDAQSDLDQALGLAKASRGEPIWRLVQAGILAAQGAARLRTDPRSAIEPLTTALQISPTGEYRSFRASLHFLTALAHRRLGRRKDAESHLRAGIEELRSEERLILKGRLPGQWESLWTACFSRSQEAYRLLIQLLVEAGREEEAFTYVEKARAYEPLDLVLRRPFAPQEFRGLSESGEPLRLAQIRKRLPAGTFLIETCVLEDRLLVWVVWRNGFELLTRPVGREALERWTGSLLAAARERNVEAFEKLLAAPEPKLVVEALAAIRKALGGTGGQGLAVFIPDGPLQGVPLAILRDPATGRRVVEEFPVAVAPSATLYVYSRLRDAAIAPQPVPTALLIGDPAFRRSAGTRNVKRLPAAVAEVRRIAPLYPGAVSLTGKDATAERFLALAGSSTVVHVAAHAFVNPRFPHRSFLLLAPAASHPGELYAEDMLGRLQLERTRVVVLSACSTAGGHAIGPEGLAALVRPLIAAGSPAVVGSLWPVESRATEELLVRFHRYYAGGEDAARALRHAQLDLGKAPVLTWAPFQVVGHAGPPLPRNHPRRDSP